MAALPNPPLLTANGDYDIKVAVGRAYLLTLNGTWGGATITMKVRNDAVDGTFNNVIDGAFTADTEQDFRSPSQIVRLTVSDATGTTSIAVAYTKHFIKL